MNQLKLVSVALIIFGFLGCSTTPPPKPEDPQSSAIGIALKIKSIAALAEFKAFKYAGVVFFAKVDEENKSFKVKEIIPSNFSKGEQVYLLNAKPGRYLAVAAAFKTRVPTSSSSLGGNVSVSVGGSHGSVVYFPDELIKLTDITISPNKFGFMGKHVVQTRGLGAQLKEPDDIQLHYFKLLQPEAVGKPLRFGSSSYSTSLVESNQNKETEEAFLNNALKHLKAYGWESTIQK